MEIDILGYTWEEIQSAQQGGKLGKAVDVSVPASVYDLVREREDVKLLHTYGEAKLREMQYFGVLDRLERGGHISKSGV